MGKFVSALLVMNAIPKVYVLLSKLSVQQTVKKSDKPVFATQATIEMGINAQRNNALQTVT